MFTKFLTSLAIIFISCCLTQSYAKCKDDTWTRYNDEKCLKLLDVFVPAAEAERICYQFTSGDPSPVLTIKTAEEETFVSRFLYSYSNVVDNVWIAISRSQQDSNGFVYNHDKSVINYTNWSTFAPSKDTEKNCVQLTSQEDGLWTDVSCQSKNLVVCQQMQVLSLENLQNIVLDNRNRIDQVETKTAQQDNEIIDLKSKIRTQEVKMVDLESKVKEQEVKIMNSQTQLVQQEVKIADSETKISEQEEKIIASESKMKEQDVKIEHSEIKIAEHEIKIADSSSKLTEQELEISNLTEALAKRDSRVALLENNPVPVGFIYTQLASQPNPTTLWPNTKWSDVTSTYAGKFFRAEGGNSAPFGSNQDADCPHIDLLTTVIGGRSSSNRVEVKAGMISASIFSGGLSASGPTSMNVRMTDGENRPINSAIRIFKRLS